jgi:ubiquinone/menaquinone biosynthesis C-methylase UbiE
MSSTSKTNWEKEYTEEKKLPSTKNTQHPSRALVSFVEKFPSEEKGMAVDLGSGNGRNSFYLANNGFEKVLGIEFAKPAVDFAQNRVEELGLHNKVSFINESLTEGIPLADESADLIIDMFVLHALNQKDREKILKEIKRVLKPNGYYLISTIGAEGEAAKDNMRKNPGPEKNSYSYLVGDRLITEKAFEAVELVEALDPLRLIEVESIEQLTQFGGIDYKHIYHTAVFQK